MDKLDLVSKKLMINVDKKVSEKLSKDWKKLEDNVKKLKNINTDGVEPMVRISDHNENYLRRDVSKKCLDKKDVLKNASESNDDFIILPRVVKND